MNLYGKYFYKMLENNVAGVGGAFGQTTGHGGDLHSSDWYQPGDARNIFGSVPVKRNSRKKKRKKKAVRVQRRSLKNTT